MFLCEEVGTYFINACSFCAEIRNNGFYEFLKMPSKDYKTASKSQIPTPVKIVRQITISPKTKRENCVVYNKQTISTERTPLFKGGLKTNLSLKLF